MNEYAIIWMFAWLCLLSWFIGCVISWSLSYLPVAQNLGLQRCQIIWIAAMPLLLPIIMSLAMIIPSLAKSMGWIHDHCLLHFQHHPHFCFEHMPEFFISVSQSTFTYSGITVLGALFVSRAIKLFTDKSANTINQLGKQKSRLIMVESDNNFAFTAGIKQPFIALSRSLKNKLSKTEQRMIIAHEVAHIRNHDVLKHVLFELLLSLNLSKKRLRNAWKINTECLADAATCMRFDRLQFASLLLRLKRLELSSDATTSIAGAKFEDRIYRLINFTPSTGSFKFHITLVFISSLFITLLSIHHHTIESIIGWWLSF